MKKKLFKFLITNCFIMIMASMLFSVSSLAYSGNPLSLNTDVNLTNSFERGFYCVNHGMHYHAKKFRVYETGTVDQLEKKIGIMDSEGMLLSFVLGETNRADDNDVKFEGEGGQQETIDGNNFRTYEPWQNYIWHLFGTSTGVEKYTQLNDADPNTYRGIEDKFNEYMKVWRQVIANGENPLNIIPVSPTGNDLLTYVDPANPTGDVLKTDDVLIADDSGRVKLKVEYPWAEALNKYYGNIFDDPAVNIPGLLNLVEIKILVNGVEFYNSVYNSNVDNKLQNANGEAFKIGDEEAYIDVENLEYGTETNIKVEWNFTYYELAQYSKLTPYRDLKMNYRCTSGHLVEREFSTYKIGGQWQNIPNQITASHMYREEVGTRTIYIGGGNYIDVPKYEERECTNRLYLESDSITYNTDSGSEKGGEYQDILYMVTTPKEKTLVKELNVFIGQPNIKINLNKIDSITLLKLNGVEFEVSAINGNVVTENGEIVSIYTVITSDEDSVIEIKPDNTNGLVSELTVIFQEISLSNGSEYLIYLENLEVIYVWNTNTSEWEYKGINLPTYDNNVSENASIEVIGKNEWRLTAENRPGIEELSGYVWIDGVTGEKKIEAPNGKYDISEAFKAGVKVHLYKTDGTKVEYDGYGVRFGAGGEGYVVTDKDGKYEFKDLPKLPAGEAYYIVFEYDGINYIRTIPGGDSKADEANRTSYDARFKTISAGQSNDGTQLEYSYSGNISTLITEDRLGIVLDKFAIQADTKTAGNTYNQTTTDINLGINRKKVDLALMTDLHKATASINGISKEMTYNTKFDNDMNSILELMQNKTSDDVEYNINLYRSDYNYRIGQYVIAGAHGPSLDQEEQEVLQNSREELKLVLEYIVIVSNQSSTDASVDEFEFYYDAHLKPINVTGGIVLQDSGNKLTITPDNSHVGYGEYREVKIEFEAVDLSNEQLVKNYVEITKYSTDKGGYVDCDSAPGNANIGGALHYEDDTDEARGVKLIVSRTDREISGNVFEDNKVVSDNHQEYITGNGKYDAGENKVDDVIVQLIEIKNLPIGATTTRLEYIWQETTSGSNVVKKVSDDGTKVETIRYSDVTPETGKYVFRGFIAGDYIVRFIYGDGTYFDTAINSENILKYNGQDYKSTIDEKYNSGYLVDSSYSDAKASMARDNEARRLEVMAYALGVTDGNDLIINSKDKLENTWMAAETSKIVVEDTMIDGVNTFKRQANFGLVERPATKLELKKHISYARLKDVTGNTIAEASVDVRSQYRDDSIEIENFSASGSSPMEATATTRQNRGYWQVEANNIDGAELRLTYKYIVQNVGEPDYLSQNLLGKFNYTGSYDTDISNYIDELEKCAREVKSATRVNNYDIANSYLGQAYYAGNKGSSDVEVKTYVNIEDYLKSLSFESSAQLEVVANNESKNIINKSANEDKENVTVLRSKNGEAITANSSAEYDVTVKTTVAGNNQSYPSYIAQIITPTTSLAGTKIKGSSPNNLKYVQSYYSVARLDDLGLGEGTEPDEFWAETFRIVPTTGADKQTSFTLIVTITAGLAVVAVGAVIVKRFLKK